MNAFMMKGVMTVLAAGAILAIAAPSFAWSYSDGPIWDMGCGSGNDGGRESHITYNSEYFVNTTNSSTLCANVYTSDDLRLANGTWVSDSPAGWVYPYNQYWGSKGFHGYGDFVEANGLHNLCSYNFASCGGYKGTYAH